jgi:hypothetical protein
MIATFIGLTEGDTLYIFLGILVLLNRQRVGKKISLGNSWALCRVGVFCVVYVAFLD